MCCESVTRCVFDRLGKRAALAFSNESAQAWLAHTPFPYWRKLSDPGVDDPHEQRALCGCALAVSFMTARSCPICWQQRSVLISKQTYIDTRAYT